MDQYGPQPVDDHAYDDNRTVNERGRLVDPDVSSDTRTYTLFLHLSGLLTYVIGFGFIAPWIMWLIKKEESSFIDDHGREATNFMISIILYSIIGLIIGTLTCGVGFLIMIPLSIIHIVVMILAGVAANRGEYYRYPMTIRFLT